MYKLKLIEILVQLESLGYDAQSLKRYSHFCSMLALQIYGRGSRPKEAIFDLEDPKLIWVLAESSRTELIGSNGAEMAWFTTETVIEAGSWKENVNV